MINKDLEEYKNLPQVSKDFLWHVEWHRKLWDWLYKDNNFSSKDEFPPEIINGLKITDIKHCCFCCEYAKVITDTEIITANCDQCFLYWPYVYYEEDEYDNTGTMNLLRDYECERSIFGAWDDCLEGEGDIESKALAKQIRDLPLEYDFIKGFLGKEGPS